jgi:protocatechuate 3,4-dioxygenase alpha subunit
MKLPLTGSQTVGPYYEIGMQRMFTHTVPGGQGLLFTVGGRLLDARGEGIPDGFLELWTPGFAEGTAPAVSVDDACGFGRVRTDDAGGYRFQVRRPPSLAYGDSRLQAPHLLVLVFMRGLLRNLVTRMYFPDEPANAADPVLLTVPAERRRTLVATPGAEADALLWDICLRDLPERRVQETVFFAW